ncbi:MAG TPA: ABC transporter permease [Thermoanaerobaculia bacterium]|nr:ABC transporter permease [Thermoanaerobaculia bacterium]
MNGFRTLQLGIRSLLRRDQVEEELDEELRFHLDMETAKLLKRGLSPAAARREALRTFGGVEKTKEQCRELRATRWLEDLVRDVRYGARTLLRSPGFSAVVVLTLGLGIGANTAIFSLVHGVLLQPLPYAEGNRLVHLLQQAPKAGLEDIGVSPLEKADYATARSFSAVAEHHTMWFNLLDRGEPERVQTGVVSADFFRVMGIRPLLGRTFAAEDDKPGAEPVLVLSYAYWQRSHGGDPTILGRKFEMNDKTHTVVGVLPPVTTYPEDDAIYMPTSACPFRSSPHASTERRMRMTSVVARLAPGASLEHARAEASVIARQMQAAHPEAYPADRGHDATLTPLQEEITSGARPTLLILLGTVGLVLLIVCANVANLTLARQLGRERELAVRGALGASRSRLIRQLLTESTLLALAGGVLGLLLGAGALRLLMAFAARFTPRAGEITVDGTVLLFTLLVALATGIASGSLPAFLRQELSAVMEEGGERVSAGAGGLRLRNLLIVAQLALSFLLLIGAGLMLRSLWSLYRVDPGFRPESMLTAGLDLDWSKYPEGPQGREIQDKMLARVQALPGVAAAALASTFPLDDSQPVSRSLRIEGRTSPEGQPTPRIDLRVASPDYFRALGVPVLRGRVFVVQDGPDAPGVALVNRTTARRFWGEQDPVGHRITFDNGENWITVVGVVGDVRQYGLDRDAADEVYLPIRQFPLLSTRLVVRSTVPPATLELSLRKAVREVDPEQPLYDVQTLEQARADSLAPSKLTALLLGLFALLALVITATGIAGLLAFSVSQRTHEIGIRMALGAARDDVLWMVLRQGAVLLAAGLGLGLLGALALNRVMAGLLYGIEPTDPVTYVGVSLVLLAVAALACWMPARRATGIHPMLALRKV